ncbi:MAG: DeoR family transcriptional regulator [Enterocloster clostridioformis]
MPANQRYTTILELLDKDRIVHTAELVKLMGVSSETIRRDPEYPDSPPVQGTRGRCPCGFRNALMPAENPGITIIA